MSAYRGVDLFGTGPHVIEAGGLALRSAVQEEPGADGVRLMGLGRGARRLIQRGRLVTDSLKTVEQLARSIEAMLDGKSGALVDDLGRSWDSVVMVRFERHGLDRLGTRWAMPYEVEYLQLVV